MIFCVSVDKRNFYRTIPRVETVNQFDSLVNTYTSQVIAVEPDIAPTQYPPYKVCTYMICHFNPERK